METINNLETTVGGWYKSLPHLPKNFTLWLATNAWWLALVGVVLGALSMLALLSATLVAAGLLAAVGGVYGAAVGGFALIATFIYLALGILNLVLTAMAIAPLKARAKRGWSLLFLVAMINAAAMVVTFLTDYNLLGMIWGLAMTAVGVYFLFEIRVHFTDVRAARPTLKKAA